MNLVVADLVDEDHMINKRNTSASAMMFGACALFTKPGQTIAPVVGWSVLSYNNFRGSSAIIEQNTVIFTMLCLVPIGCAIVQYICWYKFSLKGSYLNHIKNTLKEKRECIDI